MFTEDTSFIMLSTTPASIMIFKLFLNAAIFSNNRQAAAKTSKLSYVNRSTKSQRASYIPSR